MLIPATRGGGGARTARAPPMAAARGPVAAGRRLSAARSRRTAWVLASTVRAWVLMVVASCAGSAGLGRRRPGPRWVPASAARWLGGLGLLLGAVGPLTVGQHDVVDDERE